MIKSMTGFGLVEVENGSYNIHAELKTLNSKFLDLSIRLPKELTAFEFKIREILTKGLGRGKAIFTVELSIKDGEHGSIYNTESFRQLYKELKGLSQDLEISDADIFNNVLKLPEVLQQSNKSEEILTSEKVESIVTDTLTRCNEFRNQEGASLKIALQESITSIKAGLTEIQAVEPDRAQAIRERINGNLEEYLGKENIDENRFEQELIYYLEKLDISEEMVRLDNHLKYFNEILDTKESQGKKLGFVSQEIGREINTIGSKANDAAIQRIVVQMKDDLEKIKEQVLNVL